MKIMMNAALDELTDEQRQRVQAVSEENQIVVARTREEQLVQAPDVDIIFGSFNRFLFDAAKQLKWVQTESAGIDTILFDEFVASAIVLTSAKGTVGTHLADHSWALLLGLLRGMAGPCASALGRTACPSAAKRGSWRARLWGLSAWVVPA